ncbi:ankyrin repeat-containing domain protein, partial [Lactarius deliciosus]
ALHKRHFDVAGLLRQHGAAVHVTDNYDSRTLLHAASVDGLIDVVQWLLDHDADVNSQQSDRWTPIYLAATNGRLEVVRMLLERVVCIEAASAAGHTPVAPGIEKRSRYLLQHGAEISAQDEDYSTPLHPASSDGRLEVARMLFDHVVNAETEDQYGWCRSLCEYRRQNGDRALLLVRASGANAEATKKDGRTPLYQASFWGGTKTVRLLLAHGANACGGRTPLHPALSKGKTETVRFLLNHGANPNAKGKDRWALLHEASSIGHTETVHLLLDHGASADSKDKPEEGRTPLQVAPRKGKNAVVQMLMGHGG